MSKFFRNLNKLKTYRIKQKLNEPLDPEDILADSKDDNAPRIENLYTHRHFLGLTLFIIISLSVLLVKTAWLQIVETNYYKKIAQSNWLRSVEIKPNRGIIYDKNFNQLVENIASLDLVAIPVDLPRDKKQLNDEVVNLVKILGKGNQANEILAELDKIDKNSSQPILISAGLNRDIALSIETNKTNLSGFQIQINATRKYKDPYLFSHILGYTGKINPEEFKKYSDYSFTDQIGKTGLELIYENTLRGIKGNKEIETDSLGQVKKIIGRQESIDGQNLVLSIDAWLQEKLYNTLLAHLEQVKAPSASAVAINPKNGKLLALVSLPSFDSNLFTQGMSSENFESLKNDTREPLFNRAISGEYPPGSTIKPLIAAAALEESIITPATQFNCMGSLTVFSPYNPAISWTFPDWKAHGITNLEKAIAESSNVYFYQVGGGYGDFKGLGIERIKKYANLFGLGERLGLDLPEEKSGLIPDEQWKKETKKESWYIGDTYHASIGQGDILVTPLQLANYISAIANGGTLFIPQVIDKIVDADKNVIEEIKPKIVRSNFISKKNIKTVQEAMRAVIEWGSGRALNDLPIKVAGKTGTAQYGSKKDLPSSWFVSFAPYEDPKIVLVVLIEKGGEGHGVAAQVTKEVLEWYFSRPNI